MIKAVFFDFYNTLAYFWPPVQEIQASACREIGLFVEEEGILRGYTVADELFSRENHDRPLYLRSEEERDRFFSHYEQLILRGGRPGRERGPCRKRVARGRDGPQEFRAFRRRCADVSQAQRVGISHRRPFKLE